MGGLAWLRSRHLVNLRLSASAFPTHDIWGPAWQETLHSASPPSSLHTLLQISPTWGGLSEACFTCFFFLGVGRVGNSTSCDTISLETKLNVSFIKSAPLLLLHLGPARIQPLPSLCSRQMVLCAAPRPAPAPPLPSSSASPFMLLPHLLVSSSLSSEHGHTLDLIAPQGTPPFSSPSLKCPL